MESGSAIPESYKDLVEPLWLSDWSVTEYEELPKGPLQPGAEWLGKADPELDHFPVEDLTNPLTGRFVRWLDLPNSDNRAAQITEHFSATTSSRQEMFDGVSADQTVELEAAADHWLVQGDFPHGAEKSVLVSSVTTVGPETGAPEGFAGELQLNFHMEQVIEADPRPRDPLA